MLDLLWYRTHPHRHPLVYGRAASTGLLRNIFWYMVDLLLEVADSRSPLVRTPLDILWYMVSLLVG